MNKKTLNKYLNEESFLCNYWDKCQRTCKNDKECGTKRFYERYPEWEYIGVGAMMIKPISSDKK